MTQRHTKVRGAMLLAGSVAATVLVTAGTALAASNLAQSSYAPVPYTLATVCDASRPLVNVNVVLRNSGPDAVPGSAPVVASDNAGVYRGTATLPGTGLAAGGALAITVPMRPLAPGFLGVAGSHAVTVSVAGQPLTLAPLQVVVPPSLCAPGAAPTPAGTTSPPQPRSVVEVAAGRSKASTIVVLNRPAAPTNVHSVADGGGDCVPHVGLLGALVCPDMIRSGDLLLIWDWQPGSGPHNAIDGYKVYRVDSGSTQLVGTRANKKDLTLLDVPKPAGGAYAGRCYAVTAYAGKIESEMSPAFCAGGSSAAKTVRLTGIHMRSSMAYPGGARGTTGFEAGYYLHVNYPYNAAPQQTYEIERAAVSFDVSPYIGRRLVTAKLRLTILGSSGMGNNHSCVSLVGTGTEFWWLDQDPLDGAFGNNVVPTDAGPVIVADVTSIVAHWLITADNPNYGFILKGTETVPAGLTETKCITTYTSPVLELTYY